MDFHGLHVVVTGTARLPDSYAVLIGAGATCHIPYRSNSEAVRFPSDHAQAKLFPTCELGDEPASPAVRGVQALGIDSCRRRVCVRPA